MLCSKGVVELGCLGSHTDRRMSRHRRQVALQQNYRCILAKASQATENVEIQDVQANGHEAKDQSSTQAYDFKRIEQKWQKYWEDNKTFKLPEDLDMSKPKYYVLDMFPYPSGQGLHVGHPEGYTATDIIARYKRMKGYNVLHPMGWDAFGLPAEQYAVQTGTHPADTTTANINRFREQLKSFGFSYDWDREVNTTDPAYYKWTQWIFLRLLERDLAFQKEAPVNWCPALGTVLADEEVIDGLSERGSYPVVRQNMKQWTLRITAYAQRLLDDLEEVEWAPHIKELQKNWIGRSEGASILFDVRPGENSPAASSSPPPAPIEIYTTRPDTLFGAAYLVLAPEHPLALPLLTAAQNTAGTDYITSVLNMNEVDRMAGKEKTGIFTGSYAVNPATGENIPIWVASYVLGSYGTGAIMAVPKHDSRDAEFAEAFGIEGQTVVAPAADAKPVEDEDENAAFEGYGVAINSSNEGTGLVLDGLSTADAKVKVCEWLEAKGIGKSEVRFKLRDWQFARQRYWGEPFPVVYPEGSEEAVGVPDADLPVRLPPTTDYRPTGQPEGPLANVTDWVATTTADGTAARRETNTMPQWAGSCWYYLRYISPHNPWSLVDPEKERYWMPVDLYVGGSEHAVLHLLYARFWHKVLYDIGVVSTKEPFQRLVCQGLILGEPEYHVFVDADGNPVEKDGPGCTQQKVSKEEVVEKGGQSVWSQNEAIPVYSRTYKMSKSRGNVVNPDDVIAEWGADTLRCYEMFLGPLQENKVWQTSQIVGLFRFLTKIYRRFTTTIADVTPTTAQLRETYTCVEKVTQCTEDMNFANAISAMMEFLNASVKWESMPKECAEKVTLLLAPYAPHVAEELWEVLGHTESLSYETWPSVDESVLRNIEVRVNVGKVNCGNMTIDKESSDESAVEAAKQIPKVATALEGKTIFKVVWRPQRGVLQIVAK